MYSAQIEVEPYLRQKKFETLKYNISWLKETYPQAESIPLYFFYGYQPADDGRITRSCLSQWWVAPFEAEGHTYKTAEHWMMAGQDTACGDAGAGQTVGQAGGEF
jgi:predicted NAD-dependent protein-ADP-ribosyltransferase YbiA (DUF1768 family)